MGLMDGKVVLVFGVANRGQIRVASQSHLPDRFGATL